MHPFYTGQMRQEYESDAEYLEAVEHMRCSVAGMYVDFRHQRPYR